MRRARFALPLLIAATAITPAPARALPKDVVLERVADVPCDAERACITQMQFAPNGDLYLNVRTGEVRLIRGGKLMTKVIARVETTTQAEGGLLGLALDPTFEDNGRIYIFRTTPDGRRDLVERVEPNGQRRRLMDLPAGGAYHHGGALAFGPDGDLYVANGESHDQSRAQDPRVLGGKIYRIASDGSIPDDNPFEDEPTWSYGHRNPFGLAFDPDTGRLWETENGPSQNDEINVIERGKNYGWPSVMGKGGGGSSVDPEVVYRQVIVPTQMAFAGDAFPERYRGDLFFGAYQPGAIHRLVLNDERDGVARDETFHTGQAVVGMTFGPGGLYFSTDRTVWRIRARAQPTDTPDPSPSPTTTQPGAVAEPSRGAWWPFAVMAGIVVVGLVLALARRRR